MARELDITRVAVHVQTRSPRGFLPLPASALDFLSADCPVLSTFVAITTTGNLLPPAHADLQTEYEPVEARGLGRAVGCDRVVLFRCHRPPGCGIRPQSGFASLAAWVQSPGKRRERDSACLVRTRKEERRRDARFVISNCERCRCCREQGVSGHRLQGENLVDLSLCLSTTRCLLPRQPLDRTPSPSQSCSPSLSLSQSGARVYTRSCPLQQGSQGHTSSSTSTDEENGELFARADRTCS